ncbi:MAG TPA: hypothetical protein VLC71_09935 [Thermomonas sp.]|nr:hypothetical protein [Thermomonas sp.]
MRIPSFLACLVAVLALAACSPGEKKRRPDPRATASVLQAADAYTDGARAAVADMQAAAAKAKRGSRPSPG